MQPLLRPAGFRWVAATLIALVFCLSVHHPFGAVFALMSCVLFGLLAWFRPEQLVLMLLTLLPVASLAPQTGWMFLEEIDLLILAGAAGAYWRMADGAEFTKRTAHVTSHRVAWPLMLLIVTQVMAVAVAWKVQPWTWSELHPWGSYRSPGASLMSLKGAILLAVLAPYVASELRRDPHSLAVQVARGMILGLLLCGLVVIQERIRFTGLTNLDLPYRVTGPFWEMHVGGASLDGYLAMGTPFAMYSIVSERGSAWRWTAIASLLLAAYSAVVSLSRIPYFAMAMSTMILLVGWIVLRNARGRKWRDPSKSRIAAGAAALLACAALVLWGFDGSEILKFRFSQTSKDLETRQQHWLDVLKLNRSIEGWIYGMGSGQFVRVWQREALPNGRLAPGNHAVEQDEDGRKFLDIHRSQNAKRSAELYRVLQWTTRNPKGTEPLRFEALYRVPDGGAVVEFKFCARHLLYARSCRASYVKLQDESSNHWQPLKFEWPARPQVNFWTPQPEAMGAFSVAIRSGGRSLQLMQMSLRDAQGHELLRNGDFKRGLTYWFFSADSGHLEWNSQNIALYVWAEQGAVGLGVLLVLVSIAVSRGWNHRDPLAGFRVALMGALVGAMVVGAIDDLVNHSRMWMNVYGLLLLGVAVSGRPPPVGLDPT